MLTLLFLVAGCGAKTGLLGAGVDRGETDDAGNPPVGTGGGPGNTRPNRPSRPRAEKIDLLFMIDNSGSMGDKQSILSLAVPDIVRRLTNPLCVDIDGIPLGTPPTDPAARCPEGSFREFNSVQDVHIGVLSSSLGSHGAGGQCASTIENDRAQLLDRGARGDTYEDLGFLAWDPAQTKTPPGTGSTLELQGLIGGLVRGVGENGCGIESSLEAVYRFLIDPAPPGTLARRPCTGDAARSCVFLEGVDDVVLRQRADFLRPDSLVAIIMLTDENDCSIIDGDDNFAVLDPGGVARGTSACATDPQGACCHPCDRAAPPGCPDPSTDAECQKGIITPAEDSIFLRCFDQKRRFGRDFRYPVDRYIRGLVGELVPNSDGALVPNPLFINPDGNDRDPSLVFFAGIVGVPWQDLAIDPAADLLTYKSAAQMADDDVWGLILGDPERGIPPRDPLMIESIEERTGVQPITGEPLAPSDSLDPLANSINGHEMDLVSTGVDLQYACTFPLDGGRNCNRVPGFCDCISAVGLDPATQKRPICQAADGSYGNRQFRGKAYPAVRQLQVLEGIGENAIVASICARNVSNIGQQDFGYRPALRAILDRLSEGLL